MRRTGGALLALVAVFGWVAQGHAAAPAYDFLPGGGQELVVGLPGWDGGRTANGGGGIAIASGSAEDLFGKLRVLRPEDVGLAHPKPGDGLGSGVASGDFDGDGRADLAVGAPGHGHPWIPGLRYGAVVILYGGGDFPAGRRAVIEGRDIDAADGVDALGLLLAAGDVNGDGFDDLVADGDRIYVMLGGDGGLTGARTQTVAGGRVGFDGALAAGDVDGDGQSDAFAGWEGETQGVDFEEVPGYLAMIPGGREGPGAVSPVRRRMSGGPTSLAVGDVTGDGYADLVAGIPVDRYLRDDPPWPAGSVSVWRGGADGLREPPLTIRQRSARVPGSDEGDDGFGHAVAVGRVDGDRRADIAVGSPGEDGGRGRVTVLRGGPRGIARSGHTTLDQPGKRRRSAGFGRSLTLLDNDGDGEVDLSVLAPGGRGGGVVFGFPGSRHGFRRERARRLSLGGIGPLSAPALLAQSSGP